MSRYCYDPKFWDTRLKSLNVVLLLSPPSLLLFFYKRESVKIQILILLLLQLLLLLLLLLLILQLRLVVIASTSAATALLQLLLLLLLLFLAHLSRRRTRWAYRIGLKPSSVCPSVHPLTISNMNTRGPIATKFYLKHHWGGGKPALDFGRDLVRTLVSMATDSSHRVIMGKTASPRFLGCFWSDPFHTCR